MKNLAWAALVACAFCACARPAFADVTIKLTAKGPMGDSPATQYIKGAKMRMDSTFGGRSVVSIIDVDAKQMIVLDPQTREAQTFDLSKVAQEMQKATNPQDAKVSLTPSGQTRQILGRDCTGYMLTVAMNVTMGPNTAKLTIGGPVWVAKDAPGSKDWQTFFRAAGNAGLFVGNSPRAGASEAQVQALMYKALAETGGIPYEQEIQVKIEGGPTPGMPSPSVTMTVTGVSTSPIADDLFQVPAGYTKKQGPGIGGQAPGIR